MQNRNLFAVIAMAMVANGCMAVQPIVVGALVDLLGFTEPQAGFVAAVQMAGVGIGFLLLVVLGHRIGHTRLAIAGLATIVVSNAAACLIHTYEYMLLAQFIAGLGSAMMFTVYLKIGAVQDRPEHLFAIVNAVSIAYSGLFLPTAPHLLTAWQLPGIFLTLAGIAILASLLVPWLPTVTAPPAASALRGVTHGSVASLLRARVILVLVMMLLLYTGHGAVWAYQERIGVSLGMGAHDVGKWLGVSMLVWGVIGSLLARWLGMKIGRIWPQTLSLGLSVIAALILVFGTTPALFIFACGLIALSWFYGLPYQMGLMSEYDRQGRLNLIGSTMTMGGAALGPALAAMLVGSSGYWAIGVLAGICYLLGLAFVLPASYEQSRAVRIAADALGKHCAGGH